MKASLHFWTPGLHADSGGIDAYSRFFFRALDQCFPSDAKRLFIKNDPAPPAEILEKDGVRCHASGNIAGRFRTAAFAARGLFHGLREKPRLAIATHPNFTPALAKLKAWRGVPYVSSMHGIDVWNIQSESLIEGLRNADRLLSVSQFTKDRVVAETGIDASKIGVLPNTFDQERFQIAPKPEDLLRKYGLTPDQPVILTVGRLSKSEQYKGHDVLLEALPGILREIPDAHYLIVGKGDDQERLEEIVRSRNLQHNVTFAGFIPDAELCAHYNLCDVFAMPSTGEGFGIVFLEALGCGKPVLAGNKDASVEAVDHGNLGALVDPADAGDITQNLIQILKGEYPNPLFRQPEALRSKVVGLFGFESFKENLARELSGVLNPA